MPGRTAPRRVEWGETDVAGIVYFPNYFRWFDEGTQGLFRAAGVSVTAWLNNGYTMPIVEAHGRFFAGLHYNDELQIYSRVGEIRTRAVRFEHTVSRDGHVVCEGYDLRMWVKLPENDGPLSAEPIPDDVRAILRTFGEETV